MLPGVFERFTEHARRVVVLAQEEARRLKHNYIGTEHLLLGLLGEEQGLAAQVLESLGMTLEDARRQVERIVGTGEEPPPSQIPFTPRAKKILELALREALSLDHNHIGTEHILLGLARESEGVACRILLDFDVHPPRLRNEVLRLVPRSGGRPRTELIASGSEPVLDPGWLDGLLSVLAPLGAEIRSGLGRAPDVGDLLIACACVRRTPAHQALAGLGIDIDQLQAEIAQARARHETDRRTLATRLREVAEAKELAIEAHRLTDVAQLRDQERQLRDQAHAPHRDRLAALDELRRRLGLPAATGP
jgi:hypothetical protein